MNKLGLLLGLVLFATASSGAITDDEKFLLNNKMGSVAAKVQLGTLIETAEDSQPAALSVTASALAADSVTTAKILDLNVTTGKLAADAVTNAKLADTAVSLENLDSGIAFTNMVIQAGTYTTTGAGGDADESITAASVVGTDIIMCVMKTKGAVARTILSCAANTGTIDVVMSGDPSTDHVIYWVALRASS